MVFNKSLLFIDIIIILVIIVLINMLNVMRLFYSWAWQVRMHAMSQVQYSNMKDLKKHFLPLRI